MKLILVTVAYNLEWLEEIYKSIPKEEDIEWHIICQTDEILKWWRNSRAIVKHYFPDKYNNNEKLNLLFKYLATTKPDSYFFILDNDNLMIENTYKIYKKYSSEGFKGMIIGNQEWYDGTLRLKAQLPEICKIDSASVICHMECMKEVKWKVDEFITPDFYLWRDAHNYYGVERTKIIDETISVYNTIKKETGDCLN